MNPSLTDTRRPLVIAGQTPVAHQPGESPFDDPAPRQHHKAQGTRCTPHGRRQPRPKAGQGATDAMPQGSMASNSVNLVGRDFRSLTLGSPRGTAVPSRKWSNAVKIGVSVSAETTQMFDSSGLAFHIGKKGVTCPEIVRFRGDFGAWKAPFSGWYHGGILKSGATFAGRGRGESARCNIEPFGQPGDTRASGSTTRPRRKGPRPGAS
jgi:hypothetical protein